MVGGEASGFGASTISTCASLTAKYLIVDARPSQSAYALTDHLVHSDPIVQRFGRWARTCRLRKT